MIDKVFRFLEGEVNAYFDAKFEPATEKWVAMGNIAKLADNDVNANSSSGDTGSRALFGLVYGSYTIILPMFAREIGRIFIGPITA